MGNLSFNVPESGHRHFGLIGHPVSHSWSARYFEKKWKTLGLVDCRYSLHDVSELADVPALWNSRTWTGMNVTLPYKKTILPLMDELSEESRAIGAVNVVSFREGRRMGHNTDAIGFRRSIAPFLEGHHDRALVLGTGGSAAAVVHVLREIGIAVTRVSRSPVVAGDIGYGDIAKEGIQSTPLVVNCTPVGMFPNGAALPPLSPSALSGFGSDHFLVDLIYNPQETALMKTASSLGARTLGGESMLFLQADAAWEIWTGSKASL